MSITLRKNQIEPTEVGVKYFQQGNPKPSLMVLPTAFGKSILIAKIAESISDPVLILQPSKELLAQNLSKYVALGGVASVFSASFNSRRIGHVTYATIGSIKNIGATFRQMGFRKMIVDEAHAFPRGSASMIGKFLAESQITHVLGLTATPLKLQTNSFNFQNYSKLVMLTSRSKKGQFYKDIIYVSQIEEMVRLGYWSKLVYEQHKVDEGGLVFNSTKAEFTEESIQRTYQSNNIEDRLLRRIAEATDRRSILVFVPSVEDAQILAQRAPNAVAVYGDMPKQERDYAVNGFKSGRIRTVFNVNVMSLGFDHPALDMIACTRSTASLAWYYQALGRGTRICEGKDNCLIVDFSGNTRRFGRIEHLYYKKENIWKLYGENGILLTGCPVHEIGVRTEVTERQAAPGSLASRDFVFTFGKHKGKKLMDVPVSYRKWILENFEWNERNQKLKASLELSLKTQSLQV